MTAENTFGAPRHMSSREFLIREISGKVDFTISLLDTIADQEAQIQHTRSLLAELREEYNDVLEVLTKPQRKRLGLDQSE